MVVGAATFEATTDVNTDNHMVTMYGIQLLNAYFPSQDPSTSANLTQLVDRSSDCFYHFAGSRGGLHAEAAIGKTMI